MPKDCGRRNIRRSRDKDGRQRIPNSSSFVGNIIVFRKSIDEEMPSSFSSKMCLQSLANLNVAEYLRLYPL